MPRPKTTGPTEHELLILNILWEQSDLSVSDILERFPKKPAPAYSSLLTIVRLMEKKGYIKHNQDGKAFFYSAILKKENYKKSEVKKVADRFFGGSKFELAVNLIKNEGLSSKEIQKLKALLEEL
jgi:predicted transcriptional regulator